MPYIRRVFCNTRELVSLACRVCLGLFAQSWDEAFVVGEKREMATLDHVSEMADCSESC